jgi:hypothetical protein
MVTRLDTALQLPPTHLPSKVESGAQRREPLRFPRAPDSLSLLPLVRNTPSRLRVFL